jgi:hypothetical protein
MGRRLQSHCRYPLCVVCAAVRFPGAFQAFAVRHKVHTAAHLMLETTRWAIVCRAHATITTVRATQYVGVRSLQKSAVADVDSVSHPSRHQSLIQDCRSLSLPVLSTFCACPSYPCPCRSCRSCRPSVSSCPFSHPC